MNQNDASPAGAGDPDRRSASAGGRPPFAASGAFGPDATGPDVPGEPDDQRGMRRGGVGSSADDPRVRWGFPTALGSLLSFLVVSAALAFLFSAIGLDPVAGSVIATVVGWLGLAGLPLVVSRIRGAGPVADLALRFRLVDLAIGSGAFLVLMVSASVFVGIYLRVTGEVPTSALGTAAEDSTRSWQLVLLALLAVGASLVEEVHFRGMWWNLLRRKGLGQWATLLVTSLLFAVIHVEPQRVVLLFVAGFVIGFVRMRTGRLGPAVVAHFLVNGFGAIGLFTSL